MHKNTKGKIITKSVELFSQEGFGAVSLQEIANQLEMTRGNLTYHFKDKALLLEAIVEEAWAKIDVERNKMRQLPSFENLHNGTKILYNIQKEYSFIFLDQHVLRNEIVRDKFREMTQQAIKDHQATIAFAIKLGNMKPESIKGVYRNIAFTTWILSFYWLNQQLVRGEKHSDLKEMGKKIWSILLPHFTDKGVKSFIKFFGQEYYDNLGDAFESDLENLVNF